MAKRKTMKAKAKRTKSSDNTKKIIGVAAAGGLFYYLYSSGVLGNSEGSGSFGATGGGSANVTPEGVSGETGEGLAYNIEFPEDTSGGVFEWLEASKTDENSPIVEETTTPLVETPGGNPTPTEKSTAPTVKQGVNEGFTGVVETIDDFLDTVTPEQVIKKSSSTGIAVATGATSSLGIDIATGKYNPFFQAGKYVGESLGLGTASEEYKSSSASEGTLQKIISTVTGTSVASASSSGGSGTGTAAVKKKTVEAVTNLGSVSPAAAASRDGSSGYGSVSPAAAASRGSKKSSSSSSSRSSSKGSSAGLSSYAKKSGKRIVSVR